MTYKVFPSFIPNQVVGGRMKMGNGAFLTCKYKMRKWVGEGTFTRITGGYKPHSQRDATVELKKAITDKTFEFDNVPTSGFKYVGYAVNYYDIQEFNSRYNVVLQDPRGFDFAIAQSEFFDLLKMSGGTMDNFTLKNFECVYGWCPSSSRAFLVLTSDPRYAKVKRESEEEIAFKDTTAYITPSKLEVGKCYVGTDNMPGKHVFCGKMDVFSMTAQKVAIGERSYDVLDILTKSSTDISGKDRLVFYKLGELGDRYSSNPFVARTEISKCFVTTCDIEDASSKMFDNSGNCTLDNIMNALSESPQFNKIDFKRSFKDYEPMPRDIFDFVLGTEKMSSVGNVANQLWPFRDTSHKFCVSGAFNYNLVSVKSEHDWRSNKDYFTVGHVDRIDKDRDHYAYDAFKAKVLARCERNANAAYALVLPKVPVIYYESGKQMPLRYAMFFAPPEYAHTRQYYRIYR